MSIFGKMMQGGSAILLTLGAALPALAQEVAVPSGTLTSLFEVIVQEDPATARFRFVVPAIAAEGEGVPFASLTNDIQHLCDAIARPTLTANDWTEGQVIISLSARETAFGETAPEITQFFQPFRLRDDTCIWEDF